MGLAYSTLIKILNARRPQTEKTALLFEAALGVDAEPLMRLHCYSGKCQDSPNSARHSAVFPSSLSQNRIIP